MHDGMPYGRNQGQGQGHSREVDRQSPTGLIFFVLNSVQNVNAFYVWKSLCTSMIRSQFTTRDEACPLSRVNAS